MSRMNRFVLQQQQHQQHQQHQQQRGGFHPHESPYGFEEELKAVFTHTCGQCSDFHAQEFVRQCLLVDCELRPAFLVSSTHVTAKKISAFVRIVTHKWKPLFTALFVFELSAFAIFIGHKRALLNKLDRDVQRLCSNLAFVNVHQSLHHPRLCSKDEVDKIVRCFAELATSLRKWLDSRAERGAEADDRPDTTVSPAAWWTPAEVIAFHGTPLTCVFGWFLNYPCIYVPSPSERDGNCLGRVPLKVMTFSAQILCATLSIDTVQGRLKQYQAIFQSSCWEREQRENGVRGNEIDVKGNGGGQKLDFGGEGEGDRGYIANRGGEGKRDENEEAEEAEEEWQPVLPSQKKEGRMLSSYSSSFSSSSSSSFSSSSTSSSFSSSSFSSSASSSSSFLSSSSSLPSPVPSSTSSPSSSAPRSGQLRSSSATTVLAYSVPCALFADAAIVQAVSAHRLDWLIACQQHSRGFYGAFATTSNVVTLSKVMM